MAPNATVHDPLSPSMPKPTISPPLIAGVPHAAIARPVPLEVTVEARHRYEILVERGLLARYGALLRSQVGAVSVAVLTDHDVHARYGAALLESLARAGLTAETLLVSPGEQSKSLEVLGVLLERLAAISFDRRGVIVNFGGGVICDLGGFLASTYMRGVAYVNFSTTLIGQVDASVGGKVAVNSPVAKNLIGAFHHPRHVAGDPELLATLTHRDFRSGMAEAIKVAIISGPELFATLEQRQAAVTARDPDVLGSVILEAARLKVELLRPDPYEQDLQRALNLGHTLGHPIETEMGYRGIKHGEAVAIGMGVATAIALEKELIPPSAARRIFDLLQAYDLLGFEEPIDAARVVERVRYIRLIRGKHLYFVLPEDVGRVRITDALEDQDLVRGFADYALEVRRRIGR
jgi:3-dehydroquinate synthase